jgi:hypothetical protein
MVRWFVWFYHWGVVPLPSETKTDAKNGCQKLMPETGDQFK